MSLNVEGAPEESPFEDDDSKRLNSLGHVVREYGSDAIIVHRFTPDEGEPYYIGTSHNRPSRIMEILESIVDRHRANN